MLEVAGLPGAELVVAGLRDANRGAWSVEALLVAAASARLSALGLLLPPPEDLPEAPELALYEALREDPSVRDAYGRYNALRRELVSFLTAADGRARRARVA